jgi:hypothetical protein
MGGGGSAGAGANLAGRTAGDIERGGGGSAGASANCAGRAAGQIVEHAAGQIVEHAAGQIVEGSQVRRFTAAKVAAQIVELLPNLLLM